MKRLHRLLYFTLLFTIIGLPAMGQEGPLTFEFSFSNPGARSMALGGAFAALADDATAAYANPAGLVQLLDPEVSLEGRSWSYDVPFVAGGRVSGTPTGIGVDTANGLRYSASSTNLAGVSFLSFVYPGKKWSIAFYRHQWANFTLTRRLDSLYAEIDGELDRSEDILATTDLEVVNNGFAAAYEITDTLSLGVGVVVFQARMDSVSQEFAYDEDAFFESSSYDPELLDTTYLIRGTDTGVTLHTGLYWRPTTQWSFGGYFREGPDLTPDVLETVGPANDEAEAGTVELDATTPFHLPALYGLGVAYRSTGGAVTVGFEWDRVRYSSITDNLDPEVFDQGEIALSDRNQFHLGVEYVFVTTRRPVVALRAGTWLDPAHGLRSRRADQFETAIFDGGQDQTHVTGGLGLVFERFQFDVGVDFAETADLLSLSFVYRF